MDTLSYCTVCSLQTVQRLYNQTYRQADSPVYISHSCSAVSYKLVIEAGFSLTTWGLTFYFSIKITAQLRLFRTDCCFYCCCYSQVQRDSPPMNSSYVVLVLALDLQMSDFFLNLMKVTVFFYQTTHNFLLLYRNPRTGHNININASH